MASTITRTFTLSDGRVLSCVYRYHVTPGNYSGPYESSYPDEVDVGEPEYEIDGDPVDVASLPKGLDKIAEVMYDSEQSDKRFTWNEDQEFDEPDYFDYE